MRVCVLCLCLFSHLCWTSLYSRGVDRRFNRGHTVNAEGYFILPTAVFEVYGVYITKYFGIIYFCAIVRWNFSPQRFQVQTFGFPAGDIIYNFLRFIHPRYQLRQHDRVHTYMYESYNEYSHIPVATYYRYKQQLRVFGCSTQYYHKNTG